MALARNPNLSGLPFSFGNSAPPKETISYMTAILIPLNKKNLNGRIYNKESFCNLDEKEFLLEKSTGYIVDFSNVVGKIQNIRIEDNNLQGEPYFMSQYENYINLLKDGEFVIRPKSEAFITDDGMVTSCKIKSFVIFPSKEDSFYVDNVV